MAQDKKMKHIWMVEDVPASTTEAPRSLWTKIGVAFENKDGSWDLNLSAIPVNGRMTLRDATVNRDVFTQKDVGCVADGSLGHSHIREKLAGLLAGLTSDPNSALGTVVRDLVSDLRNEKSEDASENASEEDEAIAVLNDYCAGCRFAMVDGNLMLIADNEDT